MKRGVIAFAGAVVLLGIAAPAVSAGTRTPAVNYGSSCIDGNANGACGDAGDTPLGQALDANGIYLDTQHGSHSGLVLQGDVTLPLFMYVLVTKDIVVSGNIRTAGADLGDDFSTLRGNIRVAAGTRFSVANSLSFQTIASSSNIDVGADIVAKVRGDMTDFMYKSAGTLHVATNQNYTVSGGGYANVYFYGMQGFTLDPGQSLKGSNHGAYWMYAGSDLTLTNVNWKAGYVIINAFGSNAHPGPRNIVIRNSVLNQIYRNGNMKIYADTDESDKQIVGIGTILIDHSTLIAKDYDGGILNPLATCVASAAPDWACK